MKTIYFVRHGESVVNVSNTYLDDSGGLTELGRTQAQAIATRASKLPIETIVASPWGRTHETTTYIQELTDCPVEYSELFVERKRPTSLRGKGKSDPEVHTLHTAWVHSTEGLGGRVEDGENFEDLSERAQQCLNFLENHTANSILVVSHGYFARVLMARMLYGEKLTGEIFYPFANGFRTKHTGLSLFHYDPSDKRGNPWHVLAWNDHAHLG